MAGNRGIEFSVTGVIVPLLTLYDEQGQIDDKEMGRLVDFLVASQVDGLFPGGTTGEGTLLNGQERERLTEIVVEAVAGRVPVIVHTGAITTDATVKLTTHAQAVGADAAAIVPPFYYRYSDEEIFEHYRTIAAQVPDFPLYFYDNPSVTGNTLSVVLISRVVDCCPNVVGIKDSSGTLDKLMEVAQYHDGQFNTAVGSDGLVLAAFSVGVDACVSGNANVVPELLVALHHAVADEDLQQARGLQAKLNDIRRLVGDGRDLSLLKGVLASRGIGISSSRVRPPLAKASEEEAMSAWAALIEYISVT